MDPLQIISLLLDFVLLIAGIVSFRVRPPLGGELARGMRTLMIGVIILGLAGFVETGLYAINPIPDLNEIVHRVMIVLAIVFIILGFNVMTRALKE